ncbi:MAG: molybdate ABC transporter substrate-binding protein [Spirochaetes bacterium GWF1_31_7]|nr:MAG: molybdate ABC transporter substrate-binding protein [Spirochaetes bacterium GWE1_32_154]OHD44826.1 MAG: molybdate ABC transporter substrate-binding protein [Spirochaetes bacterium GWE2_31_10]OHD49617.1 MAG: molybdate ABC transporter substrate-binding protein [Spirochaetes bacterium GWF1_31_7]OHD79105.1 MAG: molybdate ABC transporter substrate-binding protein [Spirochaetes bacterium RIFOXYB1_FULL_32_8]HBD93742.1 molybdate ABC transporter substrate-binding protein [Spirochaetia bacterium]
MRQYGMFVCLAIAFYLTIGLNARDNITKKVDGVLTVAAAADLALAFNEIGESFEQTTGTPVKIIFSSSGTAREQIANGAPYDVYASANVNFVDELIKKDCIIADTKELYGIGRVVLAIKKNSTLKIDDVKDLLKPDFKKISIADPSHAPYGLAVKETLQSLELWEKMESKFVYGKDIQHSLTLLKTGNVEAGFISLSVVNNEEYNFIILDDALHNSLRQAIAVVKGTKFEKEARAFIKYVNGQNGRPIMKKYGFVLPDEIK